MTLRRSGFAAFALALAAAAIQVPACEYDPSSPSPDVRPARHAAPAETSPELVARLDVPTAPRS
jgi:hypothetical protein